MFFIGFALDDDTCKENDECKGKLSLCKDSAICVDEVCKCRVLKMVAAPSRLCLMKTSMYISCVFCFALSVS